MYPYENNPPLTVKEVDGLPIVHGVSTIIFPNGSVTDNGDGSVSITTGGAGANLSREAFITSGGAEAFTLAHTPSVVLSVVVNMGALNSTTGYTIASNQITLVDSNTPAGLSVDISYSY